MKHARKTFLAGVATASLLAVAACGGGDNEGGGGGGGGDEPEFSTDISGSLELWGFENADEVAQSRIDLAEATVGESDVTVETDNSAFDAQKFTTLAASGNLPDMVLMDRQFVATYAAQDLIMPLDACFDAQGVDPTSYWYPQVVDDVSYQGEVWAVPQFYQPPAIILNMRVLDEVGVTPDQLDASDQEAMIEAAEAMTVLDGTTPSRIGFDPQGVAKAALWMLSFGGGIIDDEGKPMLDDPANVEAVEFLTRLYDAQGGYANVKSFVDSFDVFGDNNSYVADQVGAALFDQWYVNVLTPYVDQIEISGMPLMAQTGEPITAASGSSLVIPTASDNPSAACAYLVALTSLEAWEAAGAARAETTANDPDRNGINAGLFTGSPEADQSIREQYVLDTEYTGFNETIATYYEVASSGQSFGSSPAGQQIQTEVQNAVTSALLGEQEPAAALAAAQEAAMRTYEQAAAGQG
ncbi:ABC transporter substrate-binding protein [Pseudactinotalea terrae]|uniref:ABC transporter substrate-binding protein n=1 Tax=Pseudactinotalea terrae TaxID=1743262 RepID=UPI0012E29FF6|nr:extracellular solute-binding protein [Pseudactinotalea terrae]